MAQYINKALIIILGVAGIIYYLWITTTWYEFLFGIITAYALYKLCKYLEKKLKK